MDKEILNMEEAAELFGVSVKTFIKLLKEEKVPARKIGREWRFSRKALIDWLSSGDSQLYSASEGETKDFFNEIAPKWEQIRSNYYDETIRNKLIESGLLKKDMTVVDLGAGDGYLSIGIAKYVKKVIALDISTEMLKTLNGKAEYFGIKNIEALEGDCLEIPINESKIDMVCSSMFLHHVEEPESAIKEMYRILKPGGYVFLADFTKHNDLNLKEEMHDLWLGFYPEAVRHWFENCGYKNINIWVETKNNMKVRKSRIFILTAVK